LDVHIHRPTATDIEQNVYTINAVHFFISPPDVEMGRQSPNIIIIIQDNVYGAVIMAEPLREFTR